jgi:hypothetical protein
VCDTEAKIIVAWNLSARHVTMHVNHEQCECHRASKVGASDRLT